MDVGTGTGRWAVEVAEKYETALVYGIDISPVQTEAVPLNAQFILMDLTEGLKFDDGSTDLVQSRHFPSVHRLMQIFTWWDYGDTMAILHERNSSNS